MRLLETHCGTQTKASENADAGTQTESLEKCETRETRSMVEIGASHREIGMSDTEDHTQSIENKPAVEPIETERND